MEAMFRGRTHLQADGGGVRKLDKRGWQVIGGYWWGKSFKGDNGVSNKERRGVKCKLGGREGYGWNGTGSEKGD